MQHPDWTNIVMAVFTIGMFVVAWQQTRHFRRTERAYVKLSHQPPGLQLEELAHEDLEGEIMRTMSLVVEIQNTGNTPAKVTGIYMNIMVTDGGPLEPPRYEGEMPPARAFLTRGDKFVIELPMRIPHESVKRLEKRAVAFVVFGYVDYIDVFDVAHRGGYARRTDGRRIPLDGGARVVFPLEFESSDGYNYDRQRTIGEGGYW